MYRRYFKRVFDVLVSLVILIGLLPIFVILTIILTVTNQGQPFFLQARPGKNGNIFRIIKFKTMNDKSHAGVLLPDAERLTGIGKFVRKTSLDEVPQLINVLIGDMSLVGPRPLLPEYMALYDYKQKRRHDVRPGITGLAQVKGRNLLTWQEKFEWDTRYVDQLSFLLDMKILGRTIINVFRPKGITSSTSATMEKFTGNVLI